jgi:hypothetical protein
MTQQLMIAYPVSCSDDLAYDEFISAAFTAAGLDGLLEEQGSGLGFGMRDHDYFFTEDISLGWHESDQHENPRVPDTSISSRLIFSKSSVEPCSSV